MDDTYGHTPAKKALDLADVYGIAPDRDRRERRPIRLGVVGAGGVAQSKYFPAIARLRMLWEPVELVAFSEPDDDQATKIQGIYGGRAYTNIRDMLAESDLDGVLVTSPDEMHEEHTLASLEAGCHVLVEKPISRSLTSAHHMCSTAHARGLILMTVATMRYAPPYRRAKRFIDEGPVLHPALFAGKFNLGYDYVDLLESGTIHLFDAARYLMGNVATVHSVGINKYSKNRQEYPVDNVVVTLEFSSGALGTLYTSSTALSFKPWVRVEVYGRNTWLAVEDGYELLLYDGETEAAKSWKPVIPNTLLFDEEFGGFTGMVENFVQAIRGAERPLVTGWDGYAAYEILVATQLSLQSGQTVSLPLDVSVADASASQWRRRPNTIGAP